LVWLADWHVPQVEVTVITQDRPESLGRLLDSLQGAHYFGDKVRLRISMDRKADGPTKAMVDRLSWKPGPLVVTYREVMSRVAHGSANPEHRH
jgi:hypothetical protein